MLRAITQIDFLKAFSLQVLGLIFGIVSLATVIQVAQLVLALLGIVSMIGSIILVWRKVLKR